MDLKQLRNIFSRQRTNIRLIGLILCVVMLSGLGASSGRAFCEGEAIFTSDPFPDPAIYDNDCPLYTPDIITVSELPGLIEKVTIRLTIYHTYVSDLDIYLEHPSGIQVELTTDNGGFADAHYIDTIFDDDAAQSITEGSAPYTGTFRPEGQLSDLINLEAEGDWRLLMCDDAEDDVGYFDRWDLCIDLVESATPTPVCVRHGDVNLDGGLSSEDAQMAFSIAMGTLIPTEEERCAADCDGSVSVTAGDAQMIFMVVLGMGDSCHDPLP